LDTLRQQMNHLFDDLSHWRRTPSPFPFNENVTWMPAIELEATETEVILKAETPGMDAGDLDVRVSEDAVSIAGEHKEEKHQHRAGLCRSEFRYGQFQRIVPLPATVDRDRVTAKYKDGVLTLTLPKVQTNQQPAVKVDLISEMARTAMAQERQQEEHLEETMHARSKAELETPTSNGIKQEARVAMTEQRQQEGHTAETMHSRAAAEVGIPEAQTNI
jgi:HSP20 family protein